VEEEELGGQYICEVKVKDKGHEEADLKKKFFRK
jgi:hypothetical protein